MLQWRSPTKINSLFCLRSLMCEVTLFQIKQNKRNIATYTLVKDRFGNIALFKYISSTQCAHNRSEANHYGSTYTSRMLAVGSNLAVNKMIWNKKNCLNFSGPQIKSVNNKNVFNHFYPYNILSNNFPQTTTWGATRIASVNFCIETSGLCSVFSIKKNLMSQTMKKYFEIILFFFFFVSTDNSWVQEIHKKIVFPLP